MQSESKRGGKGGDTVANTSGERDIRRAQDIRIIAKGLHDPTAKREAEEAAKRLERRGAHKLAKVGRKGSPIKSKEPINIHGRR